MATSDAQLFGVSTKKKQREKCKNHFLKPTLHVVNAGPPDTEYLYYPLDTDGVTLKGYLRH